MRRTLYLLGVMICGLSAASIYLWLELDEERAANAQLRAQLETQAVMPASGQPAEAAVTAPAVTLPSPTPAASTANAETPAPSHVTGRQEDWDAYRRRMMLDPRYREVQREQSRLALAPRRANLVRLLGMTPAQADAVIDLQIEREWQQADQMVNPATEELRQQQRQIAEAQEKVFQAKLQEMLGQEKNARLQHYMESRQSRMQVDTFRTQLSGADSLRDDQIEPLIEALHAERAQMRDELEQYRETLNFDGDSTDEWQRYSERQRELMKDMHAGMHASAAAILSSSQLEQLDAALDRELQRHETKMRMSKLQSKLDNAAGAAPPN